MKISIEQANKLLSGLLADVAVAENEHEADINVDVSALLNSVNVSLIKAMRPALEEELKPALEAPLHARFMGTLRSAIGRSFNIPKHEISDMGIEQLMAKCKTMIDSRNSQTDDEKQAALEKTVQGYEAHLEEIKSTYEKQLEQERTKYTQKDISARCLSIVERLPRKGGDLQEQADMLRYKMQSVYEVRYNEQTKKLEFYKEGKPAVADNSEPVNDEDFARTWAEKAGILVHDTRHISPADVKAGQQGMYASGIISISNDDAADSTMDAIVAWAEAPSGS